MTRHTRPLGNDSQQITFIGRFWYKVVPFESYRPHNKLSTRSPQFTFEGRKTAC